jgi:phage/plasmid-like protein (TIGR03299 family)
MTTDLNQAFKAEREAQITAIYNQRANAIEAAEKLRGETEQRIADGKLTPLGNGSYRVTDPGSWDDGEVWTMRQPRGIDQPLILPVSNLDESRGSAALYTRVPEWHGLGNVVPEGVSDLAEVLKLGGIDYEVVQRQVRFCPDPDDLAAEMKRPATLVVPDRFVNVREDTGAPLGIVGRVYTPVQNRDAGAFLQDLIGDHGLVFESAGALYGGKRVFIGMRLPEDIVIELPDGVTDTVRPYVTWINSHDGTGKAKVTVSPWRVACGNTERFNLRDAVASWGTRHTTNAMSDERVKEARRTLALSVKYFERFKEEEEALSRADLEIRAFEKLISEIYPVDAKATDRQKRGADERHGTLLSMYVGEGDKMGRTGYAAERAFTDYMDHVAPRKALGDKMAAARATAIVEGADDGAKSTVHKRLLQVCKVK